MSPIDWAARPLKHYADFEGRSPRSEYWWFQLFQWIGYMVAMVVMFAAMAASGEGGEPGAGFWVPMVIIVIVALGLFLPNLACMIRRLHDQDKSGWFVLLFFVPYIGGFIGLAFMCIRGTQGSNRYGPDPFTEEHLEGVFA